MATYGAIGGALQVSAPVARERASGWTRQLRVTPLPPVAYLLAKLADVVWLLAYTMLLAGLVAWAYRRQDVRAGD
jgi:ABC-2 type transport system permease protein